MTNPQEGFLLPQLNVVANNSQLKNLQNRILIDHYQRELQQKKNRSDSQKKTYCNFYNPQTRADTQVSYQYMKNVAMYNKSFGMNLANSYQKQIDRKQSRKRQQKQKELKQEQMMINRAQGQIYWDKVKTRELNEGFKRLALQQITEKQQRKAEQKKRLQEEKQSFQRRYSTNLLSLYKQQQFRKHYNNVSNSLQQNEQNYLRYVAPVDKKIQHQKQRLIQNSIKQGQLKLRQQIQRQYEMAQKYRNQLRDSLVQQIKQKQVKKKRQINELRSQGYTSNSYLTRHHPINNPVDFKITHDNKYVIKQLQSGLARSGSNSILS